MSALPTNIPRGLIEQFCLRLHVRIGVDQAVANANNVAPWNPGTSCLVSFESWLAASPMISISLTSERRACIVEGRTQELPQPSWCQ